MIQWFHETIPLPPLRLPSDQAAPLPRDGARGLGKPGRASLRLADPAERSLRRLRPRHDGAFRLDDRGDPPLHGPPGADEDQHDAGPPPGPSAGPSWTDRDV